MAVMSRADDCFPCAEEGLALHLRLCAGDDPVAVADLYRVYLGPLSAWLEARCPCLDPHLWQTAAEDAVMTYAMRPSAYDPRRAGLAAYLRLAARGDLLNILRAQNKHRQKRIAWSAVEQAADAGNVFESDPEPLEQLAREEEAAAARVVLCAVAQTCTDEERRVLDLMLAGEHKTDAFAVALGLADRPAAEQRRAVKKVKDRLKQRLKRGGTQA
jgi:hypothetical protein